MTVGFIETMMPFAERKAAYDADVTYGTNSEFGFDYLRDNMAMSLEGVVQRSHPYAIVDEVDSILIDEARTPLIISGEPETAAKIYYDFARVVEALEGVPRSHDPLRGRGTPDADYEFDEKHKTIAPSRGGDRARRARAPDREPLRPAELQLVNHLIQALKAESLYQRDVDYVIQDGEVKIVDEFTGRIMEGRRWSEGLHQAIEAKEGVQIQEEHVTLATITLQNYFRLYEKLAGMTGTAKTEEKEFVEIYGLDVVEIPTNVAVARVDQNDLIFRTKEAKFDGGRRGHQGALREGPAGARRHDRGRDLRVPLRAAQRAGHPAQRAEREAARARGRDHQGRRPARRGHDRDQHGRPRRRHQARRGRASTLGGLYVLGTERHESRRIDNQLRGRSGRQGDPGESRFYLSGEDDLVRLFAGDRINNIMERFKLPDDQPMEAKILSNQIEGAQKKVEEQNFVSRKNVLKYDDVMNTQRMVIYEQRRRVLEGAGPLRGRRGVDRRGRRERSSTRTRRRSTPRSGTSRRSSTQMEDALRDRHHGRRAREELEPRRVADRGVPARTRATPTRRGRRSRGQTAGADARGRALPRPPGRRPPLARAPREHGLPPRGHPPAAMAQKDPLVEYRAEGHMMFEELGRVDPRGGRRSALPRAGRATGEAAARSQRAQDRPRQRKPAATSTSRSPAPTRSRPPASGRRRGRDAGDRRRRLGVARDGQQRVVASEHEKVGRNDPCWCGSGKKFKKCHGA